MTSTTILTDDRLSDPFVHEALLYRDPTSYLPYALQFVYDGIAADEPVMVAAPPDNINLLRTRLGAFADAVRFHDMTMAGRNPGRIIPWVLNAFMSDHPGRRVRIIGEPIWAGRSTDEYPCCVQHEAMINVAFSGREATILCPYDVSRLDQQAVADAYETHPIMVDGTRRLTSAEFDPYGVAADYNRPLTEPPSGASTFHFQVDDLSKVRRIVAEEAIAAEMPLDRVADLKTAVNELATNSIMHGGGAGTLRTWTLPDRVICEIRDFGHITDPMSGRLPPGPHSDGGRGLVLVHFMCDLVQTHTGGSGTVVRVHMLR